MKKPRALKIKPGANDAALVPYPEVRDRFLSRLPDDETKRLDTYVAVGRFVVDRWMAEELDRLDGAPLDEHACWERWDQCSEKHLRDLRFEASSLLKGQIAKGRVGAFVADWLSRIEPLASFFKGLSWVWWEAVRGFVGAVGLLVFGLMVAWLLPGIARSIRSAVDDSLPVTTRPADLKDAAGNTGNN